MITRCAYSAYSEW